MELTTALARALFSLVLVSPFVLAEDIDSVREQRVLSSLQYDSEKKAFRNAEETPPVVGRQTSPKIIYDFFFSDNQRTPPQALPELRPKPERLANKSASLRFAWLGHSTILLEIEGKRILFDPIFSKYASPVPFAIKRFQPPAIALDQIDAIDLVVISHNHYDHLDKKTIKQLAKRAVPFVVPLGVGKQLNRWGIDNERVTEFDWWESETIAGLNITATPAQHFSGRWLIDNNKTLWASWSVAGEAHRVFFSGDSGYGPHFKAIGDKLGPFTLTLLENGAYDDGWPFIHQTPEQAVQAHIDLRGEFMLPIHWGMFDLGLHSWFEPIERVSAAAQQQAIKLITPKLGELVSPVVKIPQDPWWKPLIPAGAEVSSANPK